MERWKKKWKSCRQDLVKRRLGGIGLMVATVPAVKMLEGDATIALLTIPLGLYMFLGKSIDEFY